MPHQPAEATPRTAQRPTRVRDLVLVALALAMASAYLSRVAISTAIAAIEKEFTAATGTMGFVMSGFFLGYLLMQLPGGWFGNRLGARIALSWLSVSGSMCVVWSSLAESSWGLATSHFSLGMTQGALVPCSIKVLADWFPGARRGLASAVLGSSMSVGGAVASLLTAILLPLVGWRDVFRLYSVVGVVWAIAFYLWFRDRPREHAWTNQQERDLIGGDNVAGSIGPAPAHRGRTSGGAAQALATSLGVWLLCSQQFCRAFGYVFFVTWFPTYLRQAHGVSLLSTGLLTTAPLIGTVLGSLVGGWIVDALLKRTSDKRLSRSATAVIALALCAAATLAAAWARNPLAAVAVISLGSFFAAIAGPAAWAVTIDISGPHTTMAAAVMNMAGNLGSFASPLVVGLVFSYIGTTGDWNLVLYLFACNYLLGALFWLGLNPNRSAVAARS